VDLRGGRGEVQVARVVEGEPAAFPELLGEGLLAYSLGGGWGKFGGGGTTY
jgi:hypothetical protein